MSPTFGADLRAWRKKSGLTQDAVASQLGVSRPTLAQWEGDKHRPSSGNLARLDRIYDAGGELVRLAEHAQSTAPRRHLFVADVFRDVADALVDRVLTDDKGRPLGWSRNLTAESPGVLSTAYVVRTLQLLDDARVDLASLADVFERSHSEDGWSYRTMARQPRPEVTAVVLAALSRLGRLTDVDEALSQLEDSVDAFARSRPFVLAVALDAVLAIRPDAPLAHQLTMALLESRGGFEDRMLWTMDASAPMERVTPSVAHTARATAVLRVARSTTRYRTEVDEAIDMAVGWMSSLHKSDSGAIEVLSRSAERSAHIPIHHFTAAWTIRSLAGIEGVPASRLQSALDLLWESYSPEAHLWTWLDDGTLPSWMTHDAVSALRAMAEASLPTPIGIRSTGDVA